MNDTRKPCVDCGAEKRPGRGSRLCEACAQRPPLDSVFTRVMAQTEKSAGCWEYTGSKTDRGYGLIGIRVEGKKTTQRAHRVVYEAMVGPIADGLVLDHLCRNTSCVRPDHLEPVTQRENVMRGNAPSAANATKTHCLRGHELSEGNVYLSVSGGRSCRTCALERYARRQSARKAVA